MKIYKIVASAGTGKTTHLINLAVDLSKKNAGTLMGSMYMITFSRSGTKQLHDKVVELTGLKEKYLPKISTIHAMCYHTLGISGHQVFTGKKQTSLLRSLGIDMETLPSYTKKTVKNTLNWTELRAIGANRDVRSEDINFGLARSYAGAIKTLKEQEDAVTFSDMLRQYIEADCYEEGIKIALVDEAQDLSDLQWQVIFKAFRHVDELYVVGDPKQSVFLNFGASPNRFVDIRADKTYALTKSYRLPRTIMSLANVAAARISQINPALPFTFCEWAREGGKILVYPGPFRRNYHLLPDMLREEHEGYSIMYISSSVLQAKDLQREVLEDGYNFTSWGSPFVKATAWKKYCTARDAGIDPFADDDVSEESRRIYPAMYDRDGYDQYKYISFHSFHSCKGLEADIVVINTNLTGEFIRHWRCIGTQDNDGELAMWQAAYVGLTRARKTVIFVDNYDDPDENKMPFVEMIETVKRMNGFTGVYENDIERSYEVSELPASEGR